jgi:hypothetical protein
MSIEKFMFRYLVGLEGRVPARCGYYCGTAPDPAAWPASADAQPWPGVFTPLSIPVSLPLRIPRRPLCMMLSRCLAATLRGGGHGRPPVAEPVLWVGIESASAGRQRSSPTLSVPSLSGRGTSPRVSFPGDHVDRPQGVIQVSGRPYDAHLGGSNARNGWLPHRSRTRSSTAMTSSTQPASSQRGGITGVCRRSSAQARSARCEGRTACRGRRGPLR